ncbi:hypothetical protein GCM10020367_06190 [Streptomyces sannanensis]|uniref:Uncharacterized protein n=1 Tax=Streptomyces sannanensis TaxID=285536 RepID=A0ABP6S5I4_9ACTN
MDMLLAILLLITREEMPQSVCLGTPPLAASLPQAAGTARRYRGSRAPFRTSIPQ